MMKHGDTRILPQDKALMLKASENATIILGGIPVLELVLSQSAL